MNLIFDDESGLDFNFDLEKTAGDAIEKTLDILGLKYEAEISLLVTDDHTMQDINRKNRRIDNATDVLSFPAMEFEKPGDFSGADEDDSLFDPETGDLILGDIVINALKIRSQAADFGHTELREYTFLVVHSVLHLSGFDHDTPEREEEMLLMQKKVMNELGITR